MDGGAESIQHLHLLQHILSAGGPDDEELATLQQVKITHVLKVNLKKIYHRAMNKSDIKFAFYMHTVCAL